MMSETYEIGNIPTEIAENLKEFFPEGGDISYEEFLEQQEGVYQSIQASGKNKNPVSSFCETCKLEMDEALARSLQYLDDDIEHLHIYEPDVEYRESAPASTSARALSQNIREDDIDPDNMTYEELQSLGEVIGHERKGLSDEIISRLPTFNIRTVEECVICCAEYKNGAQLITLPCAHRYHSECIRSWLKLNKTCPVCNKIVQDSD